MDATLTALINADFEWTAHIDSIWRDTHSDIPELQRESRRQLEIRLSGLRRLQSTGSPLGLPILGEGGSGKTHLLSMARKESLTHGHFFVLADMTDIREFWETICSGYIRSLDQKVGKVTQATRPGGRADASSSTEGAPLTRSVSLDNKRVACVTLPTFWLSERM